MSSLRSIFRSKAHPLIYVAGVAGAALFYAVGKASAYDVLTGFEVAHNWALLVSTAYGAFNAGCGGWSGATVAQACLSPRP